MCCWLSLIWGWISGEGEKKDCGVRKAFVHKKQSRIKHEYSEQVEFLANVIHIFIGKALQLVQQLK